jgi:hypothetical protein
MRSGQLVEKFCGQLGLWMKGPLMHGVVHRSSTGTISQRPASTADVHNIHNPDDDDV